MIVLVATPATAVALPVPVTVPAPEALAKATTVVLSEVTVLPAASWIVAVRTRVAPEVRLAVEPVSAIWVAAPWTTVKAPRVPVVSPAAVASIVTEPTSAPVIVLVATPPAAVALPVPVTVPAPEALAKATTVVLSEVTVLPAASWIVAVSTRVAPEVRSAVEPVSAMSAAAPWTTVKAPSVPVVRPAEVASIVTGAGERAGDRLGGDAVDDGRVAGAGDRAGAGGLGERDHGRVVGGDGVAGGVLDRRGQERASRRKSRSAVEPVSAIWVAAPWTTVKAAEGAGGEAGGGRLHRDRAGERPVIVFVATPPDGGVVAGAADGAGAGRLGEGDDGRVVGGDRVAGRVLDRRGQHAGGAGGEVGRRAGQAIWVAAPWTTVKAPRVPVVSPAEVASIVTEPTRAPVIVLVATPAAAVALPVPADGAGAGCLGEGDDGGVVGGDGVAGGVLDRRGQHAGRAGGEVGGRAGERDLGGGAVDDGEGAEGAGGEPGGGRFHRHRADEGAGDRLRGDAGGGGRVAGAGHGACAGGLGEGDHGRVVGGDGVPGRVLDRRGQDAGRAGGEVGGRAGERDLGGGAVDDGEGAEGAGREPGGGRFHRHRAGEGAGDRLGRDTARRRSRCRCRSPCLRRRPWRRRPRSCCRR